LQAALATTCWERAGARRMDRERGLHWAIGQLESAN